MCADAPITKRLNVFVFAREINIVLLEESNNEVSFIMCGFQQQAILTTKTCFMY